MATGPLVDYAGIAAVITSLAVLVTALGTLRLQRKTHEKVETTVAVTKDTNEKVAEIDRAVNGKVPGSQTLAEQVHDMAAAIEKKTKREGGE